eukprot:IDg23927t1
MFNVNITALFAGAFPGSLLVPANAHKSAIQFYKVRLRARVVKWTARSAAVLESVYGFRICVERSSSARSSSNVRLSLHPSIDRMRIANALGAGAPVQASRGVMKVTDPYGVTWALAKDPVAQDCPPSRKNYCFLSLENEAFPKSSKYSMHMSLITEARRTSILQVSVAGSSVSLELFLVDCASGRLIRLVTYLLCNCDAWPEVAQEGDELEEEVLFILY